MTTTRPRCPRAWPRPDGDIGSATPLAAIASAGMKPILSIIPFLGEAMNSYKHPLRVGVGGPVGSGKTALLEALV
ncbi:Urease accessory protein UreG [Klebsiella pneumoniae]|nr:Urease accessory protein UreG [Klebsiella pneumoniae]